MSASVFVHSLLCFSPTAVQNERDRISVRRTSYDQENTQNGALSVSTLLNAEILSRQVDIVNVRPFFFSDLPLNAFRSLHVLLACRLITRCLCKFMCKLRGFVSIVNLWVN